MSTETKYITRTAVLIALAIIFQNLRYLIAGLGTVSTLIIGSLVNLCIVFAVLYVGLFSAVCVSLVTPVVALFQGHLPHPAFAPVTMAGNIILALIVFMFIKIKYKTQITAIIGVIVGALAKWGVMYYLGVVLVLGSFIPDGVLKPKQVQMISISFNLPQLVTAITGGVLAIVVFSIINKQKKIS